MNCSETEIRIQELLDSRLDPAADPALQSHLADCSTCRRVAEDYAMLFQIDFASMACSASPKPMWKTTEHQQRKFIRRWSRFGKVICTIAAVFVLLVQPIIWSWHEVSQPVVAGVVKDARDQSAFETAFAQQSPARRLMFGVTGDHPGLNESGTDDELSVASLLDVSEVLNVFDFANIAPQEISAVEPIPANSPISRMIESLTEWSGEAEMNMKPAEAPSESDQQRLKSLIDSCRELFS